MSRFLTTLVQIILVGVTIQLIRLAIQDIKENGFQFSDPKHDSKLLEASTKIFDPRSRACRFTYDVIFTTILSGVSV